MVPTPISYRLVLSLASLRSLCLAALSSALCWPLWLVALSSGLLSALSWALCLAASVFVINNQPKRYKNQLEFIGGLVIDVATDRLIGSLVLGVALALLVGGLVLGIAPASLVDGIVLGVDSAPLFGSLRLCTQ